MATALLTTKLYIAPVRPEMVSRPRLIERLNAGLHRKLTLLSAPAGFGKTTLLSEWAAGCGRPVAWVSLDKGDNDPARFWAYFIAALQTVHEGIGESVLAALQSARVPSTTAPSIEMLLTGLINEIAEIPNPPSTEPVTSASSVQALSSSKGSGRRFALVLDDFHLITDQQIHDAVAFLLDNLPPQMHLILSSRADPPWPLARLRARREMTELRVNDLRFTPAEAAAFLNNAMKLNLSPADVAALEDRCEGWIAGLQMAAISMQGRRQTQGIRDVSRFIKAFTGSHRFILDYLVEEVLDQQSSDVQEFLLKTSVLEHMTAPLCDAVTDGDDSQAVLTQLEHANLFLIPLDDERRWYRYHRLFADLLHSRLEQTQPDQVPAVHRLASEWFEKNELIPEAVSHALAAGDVERVARLVEGSALAWIYHGELTTLVGWLGALPDEVVRSRPWLCVAHAWALVNAGQLDGVEPLLQDAEKALVGLDEHAKGPVTSTSSVQALSPSAGLGINSAEGPRPELDEGQRIAGHIAAIRTYSAGLRGEMTLAAELARAALEHLPENDLMMRGFATMMLAFMLRRNGDLAAAAQAFAEAIAISQAAGDHHITIHALSNLAGVQIVQGQLHKAAATKREALHLADEYGKRGGRRLPLTGLVYSTMSTVLREWNDLEAALRHAREGLALCEHWGQADILARGYIEVAGTLQAMGDGDGALDAIQEARQVASGVSSWAVDILAADEARLRLAQGDVAAAIRWAQESGLSVDDEVSFHNETMYRTLARVLIAQGREQSKALFIDEALGLLARLLEVAEGAGAIGYVIEILVLQALALQARGDVEQALAVLERAISLAEPEGYVRTFIDEGKPMGKLLRQAVVRGIAVDYVGKLLSVFRLEGSRLKVKGSSAPLPNFQPSTFQPATLVEPLSERELEVLRLLTTRLSTTEIADQLYISVHTVRSHVKSIYGKLGVHSRDEAVTRAKELNLI
ncbi:MAG: LuxR C-terminal-related transcriptional regulator [Anaerolineae bacterium]